MGDGGLRKCACCPAKWVRAGVAQGSLGASVVPLREDHAAMVGWHCWTGCGSTRFSGEVCQIPEITQPFRSYFWDLK